MQCRAKTSSVTSRYLPMVLCFEVAMDADRDNQRINPLELVP